MNITQNESEKYGDLNDADTSCEEMERMLK